MVPSAAPVDQREFGAVKLAMPLVYFDDVKLFADDILTLSCINRTLNKMINREITVSPLSSTLRTSTFKFIDLGSECKKSIYIFGGYNN